MKCKIELLTKILSSQKCKIEILTKIIIFTKMWNRAFNKNNYLHKKTLNVWLGSEYTCETLTTFNHDLKWTADVISASIYLLKINNRWHHYGIFFVNFEHISQLISIVNFEQLIAGWDWWDSQWERQSFCSNPSWMIFQ